MILGLDNLINSTKKIDASTYYQWISKYGYERVKNYLYYHVMESFDATKDFYENQLEIWEKYGYYLATLKENPYQEELEQRVYVDTYKEENPKSLDKLLTQKEEIYYGLHLLKRPYISILKNDTDNITLDLEKIINSIHSKEMATFFLEKFKTFYQVCSRTSNFDKNFQKILKLYQAKYLAGTIPSLKDLNLEISPSLKEESYEVFPEEYLKDQIEMYIDYSIARNQFESYNMGLIKKFINDYQLNNNEEDFIQEGIIGIIRATDTFDIRKCYRFSGYAWISIQNHILRSKNLTQSIVHVPANLKSKLNGIYSKQHLEYMKTGERISLKDMMETLKIPKVEQEKLLLIQNSLTPKSLNETVYESDNWNSDVQLGDIIKDEKTNIEEEIIKHHLFEELLELIDQKLTPIEKDILFKRFGYGTINEEQMTLEKIGSIYGYTREYIRLIQKKAIKTLKKSPKVKKTDTMNF